MKGLGGAWAAVLFAAVGFGCDDGSVAKVSFQPVSGPERVDFGVVRPGEQARRAVTIQNPNSVVLEASMSLEGPGRPSFSAPSRLRLVPGATEVAVSYLPVDVDAEDEAVLRIDFPADPDVPELSVLLVGQVVSSALAVVPRRLDLGALVVGSTVIAAFRVEDRTGSGSHVSLRLEPVSPDFRGPEPSALSGSGGFEVGFVARRGPESRRAVGVVAESADGVRARAELSAQVVEVPLRCLSPIDLGYVSLGASVEGTATCENVSRQSLALGPVAATDPNDPSGRSRWSADVPDAEVPPGGSVALRVRFEALPGDEEGQGYEATVEVPVFVVGQDGLRARPGQLSALARVGSPRLAASPPSLDFGRVQLGTSSALPLTVENVGRWPVDIEAARVVGADGFTVSPPPNLLLPGERVLIEVVFSPTAVGVRTASLELTGGFLPVEVALFGEGMDGPPCHDLRAWPELPFGSVYADFDRTVPLRLENRGTSDCVVGPFSSRIPSNVPVEAPDGGQIVLGPGERRDVEFRYHPTEESRLDIELGFYVNGAAPVLPVRLTGAGVTWRKVRRPTSPWGPWESWRWPAMALPTALRFHLGPGCAAQEGVVDVTERNSRSWDRFGPEPFEVGEATIEGPDRAAFAVTRRGPAQPFRNRWTAGRWPWLGARLEVAYRPPGPGQHRAWLRVAADGIPEPITVPLLGDAGPVWVEDVIAPDTPLDVVVTVALRDPAAPVDSAVAGASTVLIGRRSDIADGFGPLWDEGVDLQVSTVFSQSGQFCPFHRQSYTIGRWAPTDEDFERPPPGDPDGSCGFFARGTQAAGPGVDWRRIDASTSPSPREALRTAVQGYPKSRHYWEGSYYYGDSPVNIAATALGWPLRNTWNQGALRPGAALAIVSLIPSHDVFDLAPLELLVALRGGKRSSVMVSDVQGNDEIGLLGLAQTCAELHPGAFEAAIMALPGLQARPPAYTREFVMASGGRTVFGACTPNWAEWIVRNGLPVNGFRTRYPLEELADGSSVEVTVGGQPVAELAADGTPNWWYVPEYNRVDFAQSAAPRRGDEVRFRYLQRCSEPL